ncbi:hypothetical protein WICANDRAFT_60555 [Wickerhamomyces anomalus NRRL Y-366-8]|uniref:Peptidase A1 domain-containing protein n=1 Tax=Wickerhamomyces anomalus (strain ATCC 58044 / CBS 1984 / NCYC 433 / NRRL Y-366-8) TaxID=683960 RepID=A0A1E3PAQ2_WICAA|nr:uncharacterized protein WICANDRAFT_60555 [Wickerhamomyces anomalus NRRL Y-366-8]ODQ62499.1 hypothetical protein WICANDRAFT_60555 [Wickerhamomyces anomalus NRRL Y-366-8]
MLSYKCLLGIASLLPQAFALLRVPVGPNGGLERLVKKDAFETDTSVQTYIIPGTDFYFGSEHQKVFVSFDTGSYTSYVQDSSISKNGFNGNDSTSLISLHKDYSVDYADGTSFKGTWVADNVSFDNENTHTANLTFGLVDDAADSTNIFGLGYYPDSPDPTFIDTLFKQEIISKRVFSVYQDSLTKGEFTFGGIDTSKFSGDLTAIPVIDAQSWNVKLFDFYHGCETLTNGNSYPILIDTGSSTGLYLPEDVYNKLINKLEAKYESTLKGYIFDCLKAQSLTLDFGGIQIEIPTSSFVQGVSGTDYCTVNWRVSSQGSFQLGWTFFNNFYFVFDAENKEILIGEPIKNSSDESVVEITGDVPSSVQAASYSQTDIVSTNSIDYTSASTVSIFASSSSLGDYYNGPTGLTTCTPTSSSSLSSSSSSSSASSISSAISSSSVISSSEAISSSESSSSLSVFSTSASSSDSSIESSSSAITSSINESSSSDASSAVESSVSSAEPSSSGITSSINELSSSAVESSSPVLSSVASIESSDVSNAASVSEYPSSFPSSFPTISATVPSSSSLLSSSPSALSSTFSGYFNSSSSVPVVSESSSALPSSSATPSINGSFVDGSPIWDVYIPFELGPWSLVEIYSAKEAEFTYSHIDLLVSGSKVSPSVFQQNGGSFQYNYDGEIEDGETLQAHIVAAPFTGQSATIDIVIAITDRNGAKLVKRATQSFTLSNTITASASSSLSSTSSSATTSVLSSLIASESPSASATVISSPSNSDTASTVEPVSSSSISEASISGTGDSSNVVAGELSTSTAVVENLQTTIATVTSCSGHVCTEEPTTVVVQTVTQTLGNIINVYTTYCPLSSDSSYSPSSVPNTVASTSETTPIAVPSTTTIKEESSATVASTSETTPVAATSVTTVKSSAEVTPGKSSISTSKASVSIGSGVESTSTQVVQVTSTLPDGKVTTIASTQESSAPASSGTPVSNGSALVSTQLVPTSTQGDSTLYVTHLVTQTTEPVSGGVSSSSIPKLLTQGGASNNGTNPQSPAQVSQYEGSGNRLVAGMLSALPIVVMFF